MNDLILTHGDTRRETKVMHKVGVHGNMSFRDLVDSDVTKGTTFGPSIGLSPGRTNGFEVSDCDLDVQ